MRAIVSSAGGPVLQDIPRPKPALASGLLRLPVDRVYRLDEAAQAFERMTRNEHFDKIVLAAA